MHLLIILLLMKITTKVIVIIITITTILILSWLRSPQWVCCAGQIPPHMARLTKEAPPPLGPPPMKPTSTDRRPGTAPRDREPQGASTLPQYNGSTFLCLHLACTSCFCKLFGIGVSTEGQRQEVCCN